jgi:hypothetical protein
MTAVLGVHVNWSARVRTFGGHDDGANSSDETPYASPPSLHFDDQRCRPGRDQKIARADSG